MSDAQQQLNNRCDLLINELEMTYSGFEQTYIGKTDLNKDFNIHWTEITCDSEEEWTEKINKLKQELNNRKQNQLSKSC